MKETKYDPVCGCLHLGAREVFWRLDSRKKFSEYLSNYRMEVWDPNGPMSILFSRAVRRSLTSRDWPLFFVFWCKAGLCNQGFGLRGCKGCRDIIADEYICQTCGLMWEGRPKVKNLFSSNLSEQLYEWLSSIRRQNLWVQSLSTLTLVRSLMWQIGLNCSPE